MSKKESLTKIVSTIDIKRKYRLLKVCYVPATNATFLASLSFFYAAATNRTNQTNKEGAT